MRIFSNFDTHFKDKILAKKRQSLSESQIIVITRSHYYFFFKVLFPFCVLLGIGAATVTFLREYNIISYVYMPLIFVWVLVVWFRVAHKLLKYLYDFTIVMPRWIITYKQKGILHSSLKEIPAKRIRSIQVCRNTFLGNVFWYWSIDILTDLTDNMHIWEEDEAPSVIWLTHVDKPYKIKTQITDMCFK